MKILRGCSRFTYQVDRSMFWQLIWQAVCALIRGTITVRVTLTDDNMPIYPDYASLEQLGTDHAQTCAECDCSSFETCTYPLCGRTPGDNHVRS